MNATVSIVLPYNAGGGQWEGLPRTTGGIKKVSQDGRGKKKRKMNTPTPEGEKKAISDLPSKGVEDGSNPRG